ncbi:Hypothetical predicted protein [Octopus vulgaris]|uniref:CUB domain-containing protein n=1 Tax=Octopus vulgaris TaxID=6645 RepID=A0AA36ATM1_OCTVU|nr:Hypothetical predicted protein [Octopus vulgaris]
MLGLFYNKPNIFSSGFVLTYKTIPRVKKTCPENKVYKYPGIKDQFMISTASGTDYNLPDYCHFTLHTDESSYIELDLQQLDINNSCLPSYLDMSINNLSFPSEIGYFNHQVSMQAKSIHIQYLKKTQCKFLILFNVKSVTGKSWQLLLNSKMSTSQTTFQLKYKIKPRYKIWHAFGNMIIIYNSVVQDETPSTTQIELLSRITSTKIQRDLNSKYDL